MLAVSLMLVFYALEHRSRFFVLAFAGACLMGSAYGFLQGAWPFGVVEVIWSSWRSAVWSCAFGKLAEAQACLKTAPRHFCR